MGLFDRMSRVISSNFNALLDKAEDPRKSIELTLEEMAQQVKLARQEVVRGVAAEKQLRQKVQDLDAEVEKWASRAELAVKTGDDALAREALVQKKRVVGERDRAEALRGEQRSAALELKAELERMEIKITELKARKGTLAAQAAQLKSGASGVESLGASPGGKPFDEFRRMEDQLSGVETAIEARREIDEALSGRGPGGMTPDEVEARFRALESGSPSGGAAAVPNAIDEELEAIKRKIRVGE
jgi:phage shock protein A